MAFNEASNATTGVAPFRAALDRLPHTPIAFLHSVIRKPLPAKSFGQYINDFEAAIKAIWAEVRQTQQQAEATTLAHEPERLEEQFHDSDEVLVDGRHLAGMEGTAKQHDRMGGPYIIASRVSPGAYRLSGLPKGVPEVWNQDRLKLYHREPKALRSLRSAPGAARLKLSAQGKASREVEAIVGVRPGRLRHQREFCVQWKGVPEASWEKEAHLAGCQDLLQEFLRKPTSPPPSEGPQQL